MNYQRSYFERKRVDSGSVCRSACVVCATCGRATRLESLSHPLVRDRISDSICVRRVHVLTASVQRVHMRVHHGGVLGVVHHQGHFLSGAQSFLPLLRQLPADTKKS